MTWTCSLGRDTLHGETWGGEARAACCYGRGRRHRRPCKISGRQRVQYEGGVSSVEVAQALGQRSNVGSVIA